MRLTPPNNHPIARRNSPVERSIRKDVTEVAKEEKATPARIKFVVGTVPPIFAKT
jgi:hypothetical protein